MENKDNNENVSQLNQNRDTKSPDASSRQATLTAPSQSNVNRIEIKYFVHQVAHMSQCEFVSVCVFQFRECVRMSCIYISVSGNGIPVQLHLRNYRNHPRKTHTFLTKISGSKVGGAHVGMRFALCPWKDHQIFLLKSWRIVCDW